MLTQMFMHRVFAIQGTCRPDSASGKDLCGGRIKAEVERIIFVLVSLE